LKLIEKELRSRGVSDKQIIKIDFESLSFESYKEVTSLYDYVTKKAKQADGRVYILIDEIQEAIGWEKAVRSFKVDLDCDIFITGSNANLLSSELATFLAGRYIEFELHPLSFKEHLDFYEVSLNNGEIENAFADYLKYGGFPGLYHMPQDEEVKIQYLKGIYNTVILKDVIQRNHIRDAELLERIFIYIMDNIGQIFSATNIAKYLKSQGRKISVDSVYSYIRALEDALIIHAAKRYDVKGKKVLERMEKYFLSDLGLRCAVVGYRENDIAQILENIVYLELLRRGYQVYVGKEDTLEIDFVASKNDEKIYFQVTYLLASEEVVEREYRPLLKVKDHHAKLVLSMDRIERRSIEGVRWMNLIDFLLE